MAGTSQHLAAHQTKACSWRIKSSGMPGDGDAVDNEKSTESVELFVPMRKNQKVNIDCFNYFPTPFQPFSCRETLGDATVECMSVASVHASFGGFHSPLHQMDATSGSHYSIDVESLQSQCTGSERHFFSPISVCVAHVVCHRHTIPDIIKSLPMQTTSINPIICCKRTN